MKIALFGKKLPEHHVSDIQRLFKKLMSVGSDLIIYKKFKDELLSHNVREVAECNTFSTHKDLKTDIDLLLSLGGDGTLLDTITMVRKEPIPILGVNTGRLGFLSNTSVEDIESAVEALMDGAYSLDKRSLLQVETKDNLFGKDNFALNELSLVKRDSSSMITIHTELDGKHLNSYWADGLIVSTATGSTAYSLSCGGPIIMPGSGNFVLTPIAPHNLNVRPIVVDSHSEISLTIESRSEQNLIALDSRSKIIKGNQTIIIKKAGYQISLVRLQDQDFISSLKNKLNWGLDRRNK